MHQPNEDARALVEDLTSQWICHGNRYVCSCIEEEPVKNNAGESNGTAQKETQ